MAAAGGESPLRRITRTLALAAAVVAVAALSSCYVIPFGAYGYISNSQLRTLASLGLPINDGRDPPDITGTYLADSLVLLDSNFDDFYSPGDPFADMEIQFYSQASDGTVLVSYDQSGLEWGTGIGAFISGEGNDFTVYAQITGTSSDGIDFEDAMVFSGTLTPSGIANFAYGLLLTDKSYDPYDYLIDVGDARVFDENDGLAANWAPASIHPAAGKPAGSAR
jgi:hypothetical protein